MDCSLHQSQIPKLESISDHPLYKDSKCVIDIEKKIFNINSENFENLYDCILRFLHANPCYSNYIFKLLLFLLKCRPSNLFSTLSLIKKLNLTIYLLNLSLFPNINYSYCILNNEKNNIIQYYVKTNDLQNFINFLDQNQSFNFNNQMNLEFHYDCLNSNITLLEYSIFYGSIKIFYYLLNNKIYNIDNSCSLYSIASGELELIRTLINNNINYDQTLWACIEFNRNSLFDFLITNYKNNIEVAFLSQSINYFNDELFIYSFLYYYNRNIGFYNMENMEIQDWNDNIIFNCIYHIITDIHIVLDTKIINKFCNLIAKYNFNEFTNIPSKLLDSFSNVWCCLKKYQFDFDNSKTLINILLKEKELHQIYSMFQNGFMVLLIIKYKKIKWPIFLTKLFSKFIENQLDLNQSFFPLIYINIMKEFNI